ncbi:hypothetical protein Q31b_51710 [Novipirellula aureliae]|uniref:Uncharacterized protein n=1 Tax=Novipirellula aureliae TaxID=2527966 RepID=A0A5C6DLD4_9BACT|nr:hypothetical protein Q31b_51710 [Novipirellula aureliae]
MAIRCRPRRMWRQTIHNKAVAIADTRAGKECPSMHLAIGRSDSNPNHAIFQSVVDSRFLSHYPQYHDARNKKNANDNSMSPHSRSRRTQVHKHHPRHPPHATTLGHARAQARGTIEKSIDIETGAPRYRPIGGHVIQRQSGPTREATILTLRGSRLFVNRDCFNSVINGKPTSMKNRRHP